MRNPPVEFLMIVLVCSLDFPSDMWPLCYNHIKVSAVGSVFKLLNYADLILIVF